MESQQDGNMIANGESKNGAGESVYNNNATNGTRPNGASGEARGSGRSADADMPESNTAAGKKMDDKYKV